MAGLYQFTANCINVQKEDDLKHLLQTSERWKKVCFFDVLIGRSKVLVYLMGMKEKGRVTPSFQIERFLLETIGKSSTPY